MTSLVLTDSSQLTSDSQHLGIYSSPMASLVLTDSFEKLPDQIIAKRELWELSRHHLQMSLLMDVTNKQTVFWKVLPVRLVEQLHHPLQFCNEVTGDIRVPENGRQGCWLCLAVMLSDCNKVLLVYGLTNLAKMEEESLDKMDPYQRGATDIIWESMMKGTYKTPGDNQEPLDYSYASAAGPSAGSGSNNLGSQEEASSTVEQFLSPGHNQYIIGPMVVRVMPDGRPVPGESPTLVEHDTSLTSSRGILVLTNRVNVPGDAARPLPKDEDAEEFKVMRSKPVPSVEEIISRQTSYQRPRQLAVPPRERQTSSQPQAVYMAPPSQYKAPLSV
uniref:(California timema) hypothetical protein n=1 Tax=Timema californicum TaxID=61474 RepID=A0A7R9PEK5_TIMCA|nr:unnamed protein product [Timema californicum]